MYQRLLYTAGPERVFLRFGRESERANRLEVGTARSNKRYGGLAIVVIAVVAAGGVTGGVLRIGRLRGAKAASASIRRLSVFPPVMLWAWERPEDLSFIDPKVVGVAYLAKTLSRHGDMMEVRPRLQPLTLPDGTVIMSVVRIENGLAEAIERSGGQESRIVSEVVALATQPGISGIQIDFDAKASERSFYARLLMDVRSRIPEETPLSITALASWCMYDRWLEGLPVDEAVPMLFRMGADRHQVLSRLESGGDFGPAVCQHSLGISIDEPIAVLPRSRRVYAFSPKPWSVESARDLMLSVTSN